MGCAQKVQGKGSPRGDRATAARGRANLITRKDVAISLAFAVFWSVFMIWWSGDRSLPYIIIMSVMGLAVGFWLDLDNEALRLFQVDHRASDRGANLWRWRRKWATGPALLVPKTLFTPPSSPSVALALSISPNPKSVSCRWNKKPRRVEARDGALWVFKRSLPGVGRRMDASGWAMPFNGARKQSTAASNVTSRERHIGHGAQAPLPSQHR